MNVATDVYETISGYKLHLYQAGGMWNLRYEEGEQDNRHKLEDIPLFAASKKTRQGCIEAFFNEVKGNI